MCSCICINQSRLPQLFRVNCTLWSIHSFCCLKKIRLISVSQHSVRLIRPDPHHANVTKRSPLCITIARFRHRSDKCRRKIAPQNHHFYLLPFQNGSPSVTWFPIIASCLVVCVCVSVYDSRIRLLILIRLVILFFFTTNFITPTAYCFFLCSLWNCYLLLALLLTCIWSIQWFFFESYIL